MSSYEQMAELQRDWTPPRELKGSVPREIRLTGQGVATMVLGVLLWCGAVGGALALNGLALRQANDRQLLAEQGVETSGTITRLWRDNDKSQQPLMTYRFVVGGVTYTRRFKLSLKVWRTLSEGQALTVRYVPAKPTISRPSEWEESPLPPWVALILGASLAACGTLVLVMVHKAKVLLSDGRPAPAVVTRYSAAGHGQKLMHYEFPLSGGGVGKGKSGAVRTVLPIGTRMCIVYDRENPRRSAAYPFKLVRVDRG